MCSEEYRETVQRNSSGIEKAVTDVTKGLWINMAKFAGIWGRGRPALVASFATGWGFEFVEQ